jgi:hypothetical protein
LSTRLNWSKAGLVLTCETAKRALPRTAWAFSLPPFTSLNTCSPGIQAVLVMDSQTGIDTAIRITSIEDLPGGYSYSLFWTAYQGAAPDPLVWTQVSLGTSTSIDLSLPIDLAGATYCLHLSRTWSGIAEDYQTIAVQTPVEAIPDAVTGLTNYWSGTQELLQWDRSLDPRGIEYEIRMGSDPTKARVMGRLPVGITNLVTVSNGTYWVAQRYRGIYSAWSGLSISGSAFVQNVVQAIIENPGWTGTKSAYVGVDDLGGLCLMGVGLWDDIPDFDACVNVDFFGGIAPYGTYESATVLDLSQVESCGHFDDSDWYAVDQTSDFDNIPDFDACPDTDGSVAGMADIRFEIALAQDDGVFGSWQPITPGKLKHRYCKRRAVLTSSDPQISSRLASWTWTVDMEDRWERYQGVDVPVAGIVKLYSRPFQTTPNLQITIVDLQPGDDWVFDTPPDRFGFSGHAVNTGVRVERHININAQGY